jgi:hypothetical protein
MIMSLDRNRWGFHAGVFMFLLSACTGRASSGSPDKHGTDGPDAASPTTPTTSGLAALALANLNGTACGSNSLGGHSFESSCTGNNGLPEYWCSDFVKWVWANNGVDTSALSAAAGSFYVYGQNNNTLFSSPQVGDAVVFDYHGSGSADHVAIVTQINDDGTIETLSGDWNGSGSSEAQFSSTSSVVLNSPSFATTVYSCPASLQMDISGFISPLGLGGSGRAAGSPPASSCTGVADGSYCGWNTVLGDPNTLYQCSGGQLVGRTACSAKDGCQINCQQGGDICGCAALDDGNYCGGDDIGGDPNTLYQCGSGTLTELMVCANGCQRESGTINDKCK